MMQRDTKISARLWHQYRKDTGRLVFAAVWNNLHSRRRHWMDTRLRIRFRADGYRMQYLQFDYSSSGTDDELYDAMLPMRAYPQDLNQPEVHAEQNPKPEDEDLVSDTSFQNCLPQLFSDNEPARSPSSQPSTSDYPPPQFLVGTSSPMLPKPSLSDYLSNYAIWPNQAIVSNISVAVHHLLRWLVARALPLSSQPLLLPKRPRKKPRIFRQRKTPAKLVTPPARTETQTRSQDRYQ